MQVLLLLGFVYAVHSASVEPNVISIESSQEDVLPQGRFIFAATVTQTESKTVATVTSTSVTQNLCYYTTGTAVPTCVTDSLTGRRKRAAALAIEKLPAGMAMFVDGAQVNFEEFLKDRIEAISPTPRQARSAVTQKLEFRRMELVGGDDCLNPTAYGARSERADPRFVTFRTTTTTSVTATTTLTTSNSFVNTVIFTHSFAGTLQDQASVAAGKAAGANKGGCIPVSLLSKLSMTTC